MNSLLQAENLHKTFGQVEAVRDVSLEVGKTDFLAIIGRSGSGKTTALHLLAGLESPNSGRILFQGKDISPLNEDSLALWRREHVGLVFQSFYLIPTLSALENVAFPLYPSSMTAKERHRQAITRLKQVGMGHRQKHRPGQLSGGEQQRVAIARALINNPNLILADEPTGNLDSETGAEIMQLLRKLNLEDNVAVVIITHDPEVAAEADRVIKMKDGKIVGNKY
ncbi:MAG: ABC transporter ATP-binding protein [Spirochaetia bacterium]|jgi:putative ABC transport system ATP-binding protein|nr:ABC transporter ATP-binding protein [Spirochaetia bacterium]